MAQFNNPASVVPGSQNPLLGTPSPFSGYNPLNSGNQQLDMMFAMYAPQLLNMFGMRDFLPQQFPAQNMMDQMVSAKYMRSMQASEQQSRSMGTDIMAKRFIQMRSQFDHTPLSPMGAAQFNTIAGAVNNNTVMPMLEMMMGAQNVEDVFFGRKGDPTQLQRAVNAIGFYRPDSVTGGSMMSGDSLQQFSNQIYNNLYGPDADLNDVSGFSAGRVGSMMTDLARRGLLPQSMSRVGSEQRGRELSNLGFDAATGRFSDAALDRSVFGDTSGITDPNERAAKNDEISKVRKAIQDNAPLEEIEELAGGADTIRRIDASRVANSLKGYSEAVGAVRQIFGDNGMGNAPMGQLIAALEALTQNSMSAMAPAKIENLMRRTQMASREGGVSLEALMGLSARTGALAQQRGLTPEIAAFTNVTAMEYASSMRDNGGFRPGFGRMDADKAMLFLAEAGLNAEDSNVGRQLGALERIVQSGGDTYKTSDAAKMLEAVKRGDTSFVNAAGDTVNIAQEMGRNPLEFMRNMVTNMGVSTTTFDALARDTATQEFKIGLEGALGLARQGEEYKTVIGQQVANRGQLGKAAQQAIDAGKLSPEDFEKINRAFSSGFGRDVIDLVDNTQTPEERLETLYQSMRRSVASTTGLEGDAALAAADKQIESIFGAGAAGQKAAKDFLLGEYAAANIDLQQNFGLDLARGQQVYASRNVAAATARSGVNNMRAGINISGGDGSNFIQRFSDAAAGEYGGRSSFLNAILGTVDSKALEDQLMQEVEKGSGGRGALDAAFSQAGSLYSDLTVDTATERKDLVKKATESASGFAEFVQQATDSFGADKNRFKDKKLLSDADLEAKLRGADNNKLTQAYLALGFTATTDRDKMITELLKSSGDVGLGALQKEGIIGQDEVTTKVVSDFINNEQVRIYQTGATPEKKAQVEAFDKLGRQLDAGAATGATIAASFGVTDKKTSDVIKKYLEGGGGDDFSKELAALGLDPDQTKNIEAMSRFAKQSNAMGGMSVTGAQGAAGRRVLTSRMAAVNSSKDLDKNSALVRAVKKKTEDPDAALTKDEQAAYDTLQGDEAAFRQQLGASADISDGKKTRSGVADDVMKDAGKMAGAVAEGAGGVIGQITSALSSAMGDLLKDVKVEVTKLPDGFAAEMGTSIGTSLVAAIAGVFAGGAAAAPAATTTAASGPLELRGTVTLNGLDKLVAELQGDTATDTAPGGIPVTVQSPPRASTTVQS